MPANKKYLSGPWKRFSKVTAAILGGYFVTAMFHAAVARLVPDNVSVIMSASYTSFFVWVGLMVLAFFIRKAWHVWSLYLILCGICFAIVLL